MKMKKLFLILLLIVIVSFQAHATEKFIQCRSLFGDQTRTTLATEHIADLIAPYDVKKRLLQQTYSSLLIRDFVIEYSQLINDLYMGSFFEALYGNKRTDIRSTGFTSVADAKSTREDVINKQIKILSIMDSQDLTPEFARDFKLIAIKVYDDHTRKKDLIHLSKRLDSVITMYSQQLF